MALAALPLGCHVPASVLFVGERRMEILEMDGQRGEPVESGAHSGSKRQRGNCEPTGNPSSLDQAIQESALASICSEDQNVVDGWIGKK